MKKINWKKLLTVMGITVIYTGLLTIYHIATIEKIDAVHHEKITALENQLKDNKAYKIVYEDNQERLNELQTKYDETNNKLKYLEEQIFLSKEEDAKYNSTNFANKNLSKFPILTVDEMNDWIAQRAPENSSFIGKGKEFLDASKETELDPRYLVAHAALESAWGTSSISKDKNNYYGIAAYNHDPYNSAKTFPNAKSGILEGAKWIKTNYIDQDQNTLNKMIYGKKSYCVENDGTPSQSWIDKIVAIIY